MTVKTKGEGFTPPNYTQTPNTLFDLLAVISNAELRVTLALVRETFGWHKQRTDRMSITELADLAGLSPSSAKTGVKEGLKRGTIKRFKAKDEQNRQTYRYGLVITDRVNFEEFERPRKEPETPPQDKPKGSPSGQNLTGSEIDGVGTSSGQNLTGSPVNSSGQNLTTSNKEERKPLEGKKVVVHNVTGKGDPDEPEHDDDGSENEQMNPPLGVRGGQAGSGGDVTPVTDTESAGEDDETDLTGGKNVPRPPAWNPADVNAVLDEINNGRWLTAWKKRGEAGTQKPMIEEMDGSGVERREIALRISPTHLNTMRKRVRNTRDKLIQRQKGGETLEVFSFQHMLIQELQAEVITLRNLEAAATALKTGDEPVTSALPTRRDYQVGDRVLFERNAYEVERVEESYIDLYDDTNGTVKVVRNTRQFDGLKLLQSVEASA